MNKGSRSITMVTSSKDGPYVISFSRRATSLEMSAGLRNESGAGCSREVVDVLNTYIVELETKKLCPPT